MHLRRRRLRAALAAVLLLLVVVGSAQLAGVTGSDERQPAGPQSASVARSSTYLVHGAASAAATRSLRSSGKAGDGFTVRSAGGGWSEVQLADDQPEAVVVAALEAAGADNVEVVAARVPYDLEQDGPQEIDDPTTATPPADAQPQEISDSPGALAGGGEPLRAGPVGAQHFAQQWALEQPSDEDIDAPEAWQLGTGSADVVVAVIDTGVDSTHPDLAGRLVPGRDFAGSATGANVDRVGHGTMVASVIAGAGTGMAGVAPGAKIMPLKVFRDSAIGFSMSGYLMAIRYAADNGADVINISLGCGGTTSCWSDAEFDALEYARSRGVLVVTAAGNGDNTGSGLDNDGQSTPDYPSGYDLENIVAVTSSTRFGNWSTWANFGRTTVDLAAPGEQVLVAKSGGGWGSVSGTSFSAPYVAGVAALVEARQPGIQVGDLRARLLQTVVAKETLAARSVSGGIVNADAAVRSTVTGGGAAPAASSVVALASPANRARVASRPTLTWRLPAGWRSSSVRLRQGASSHGAAVPSTRRAFLPPRSAWASGAYSWSVVAVDGAGRVRTSAPRTYVLLARHSSTVVGGKLSSRGRVLDGRVRYRTSSRALWSRLEIRRGSTLLYSGPSTRRTGHLSSARSPRGASFTFHARLNRMVRAGDRLVLTVTLTGGGEARSERWPMRVS